MERKVTVSYGRFNRDPSPMDLSRLLLWKL